MIRISEWMPNPVGNDAVNEWIELQNDGNEPAMLAGWAIRTDAGKQFLFKEGTIGPEGSFVLRRPTSKLTLRNSSGELSLIDPGGKVVQQSFFVGEAPEGKSVLAKDGASGFGEPTPGERGERPIDLALIADAHRFGVPLIPPPAIGEWMFAAAIVGAALTASVIALLTLDDDLSNFIFGRDENAR